MPACLAEWLDHIGGDSPHPMVMGLDRISAVWAQMGLSLADRTVVTVGGTNGKGSCAATADSILNCAGYKTMLYSSPHLRRYNERVRIAGDDASDDMLCASFAEVDRAKRRSGIQYLTYFEFGTLAAAWCAIQADCEVLVLEVGLGGRLDAVNLFDADVAVIVSVGMDHVEYLGDDLEQIGWEKAHIMRPRTPAIIGGRPPKSLRTHAHEVGADIFRFGEEFTVGTGKNGSWNYHGIGANFCSLPYPKLNGRHQLANAACALAALETQKERFPVASSHVRQGLLSVRLEGRLQVIPGQPCTVLDVAHNRSASERLASFLLDMGYFPNTVAVCGIMGDKDIEGMIDALLPEVDLWLTVPLDTGRGVSPTDLATMIRRKGAEAIVCDSVSCAKEMAHRRCGGHDRILIFGSFLTVSCYLESESFDVGVARCR